MSDLIILTADGNMEALMKGLMSKIVKVETVNPFTMEIKSITGADPAMRNRVVEFARPLIGKFKKIVIMLDFEGSGANITPQALQTTISQQLAVNGWNKENHHVVVFEPECDAWLWVAEAQMRATFKSPRGKVMEEGFRSFLIKKSFELKDTKPSRPKEAIEAICKELLISRTSSLYEKLAANASYKDCTDPAFLAFITQIRNWFAEDATKIELAK